MKKNVLICLLVMALLLLLSGCGCDHEWYAATCKAPKTCSLCGQTEGEALPHTWLDATCTTAKICTVCDTVDGEALGHSWQDPTCTDPKTCTRCDLTEGEAAGHQWEEATTEAPQTCSACKKTTGKKLTVDPRFTTASTKVLHGTWSSDITVTDEMMGLEGFGGVECRMVLEFGKTGVMTLHVEVKDKDAFQDQFRTYTMNMLYEGFAAEGLSKEEADQMMLAASDMTVSEYVDAILQQVDFSELFATFHTQEVYYVQDGQLFAALNWDAAFEGKTFTLTDGKLVIEGITLEEGGEPLIWTKA